MTEEPPNPGQPKPESPPEPQSEAPAPSTMDLIRKLDTAASALREVAEHIRRSAPEVADPELRREMLDSADGMERRARAMAEAIERWRVSIN